MNSPGFVSLEITHPFCFLHITQPHSFIVSCNGQDGVLKDKRWLFLIDMLILHMKMPHLEGIHFLKIDNNT